MLIDTHCHLTSDGLVERIDDVLTTAREADVRHVIQVAVNLTDADRCLGLMRDHSELSLVLGVHPHEAHACGPDELATLRSLIDGQGAAEGLGDRIVGVGETGLDFFYDFSPRDVQEATFRAHIELALAVDRPLVIHARDAELRACDLLAEHPRLAGRVVFHCFSGDVDVARRVLDLGYYLSFTGVVTFKKSERIRAAARYAPLDRIMVETDAPYMSPEPVRNIRPNEPALVVHTARHLADVRNEDFDTLAAATTANARRFFKLTED